MSSDGLNLRDSGGAPRRSTATIQHRRPIGTKQRLLEVLFREVLELSMEATSAAPEERTPYTDSSEEVSLDGGKGHSAASVPNISNRAEVSLSTSIAGGSYVHIVRGRLEGLIMGRAAVSLNRIPDMYENKYGEVLVTTDFGFSSVKSLLATLPTVEIFELHAEGQEMEMVRPRSQEKRSSGAGASSQVTMVQASTKLQNQLRSIITKHGPIAISLIPQIFLTKYSYSIDYQYEGFHGLKDMLESLPFVDVYTDEVNPTKWLVRVKKSSWTTVCSRLTQLAGSNDGHGVPLGVIPSKYWDKYGEVLSPKDFGCTSLHSLIMKIQGVRLGTDGSQALVKTNKSRTSYASVASAPSLPLKSDEPRARPFVRGPTKNLYVKGFGAGTTDNDLLEAFSGITVITSVRRMGKHVAFLNTPNKFMASTAISVLNGTSLNGGVLEISYAKEVDRFGNSF